MCPVACIGNDDGVENEEEDDDDNNDDDDDDDDNDDWVIEVFLFLYFLAQAHADYLAHITSVYRYKTLTAQDPTTAILNDSNLQQTNLSFV